MFALHARQTRPIPLFNQLRTRNVGRTRIRGSQVKYQWNDDVIERDERLLANLEKKLAQAKARLANEEKQDSSFFGRLFSRGERKKSQAMGLPDLEQFESDGDNAMFWKEMLPKREREQLAAEGITSLSGLYAASHEADELMGPPSFTPHGELSQKHRLAHRIQKNIPRYLARAAGGNDEDVDRIRSG